MSDKLDMLSVGDTAELEHRIREKDVQEFCDLTGDNNPLHMDDSFARASGFGKRVVHGMLTASFISTIVGTKLPGPGALWYEQSIRFLRPVRLGETIRVQAKILQKSVAQRLIVLETIVLGENGERVLEGEAKVKILKPETEEKSCMGMSKNNAVIVTGASRGIGAAIARSLAESGHPVLVNYSSSLAEANEVVSYIQESGGRAMAFQCDVRDAEQVAAMVEAAYEEFGTLAGAVHNASSPLNLIPLTDLNWEQMQQHMDVQLKGAHNLLHALLPHFLAEERGLFLSIASSLVDNVPPLQMTHYVAAKAALAAFTKCVAAEFGPKGVRAMCVSPGMTRTALIANFPEKAKMVAKVQAPLRRLGEPEDVAGLVAFLFSPAAEYLTGQNFRINGGSVMA